MFQQSHVLHSTPVQSTHSPCHAYMATQTINPHNLGHNISPAQIPVLSHNCQPTQNNAFQPIGPPEPTYKGMSSETFHEIVRDRLEAVAQKALNRTDGEREYQRKHIFIKNRLRYFLI